MRGITGFQGGPSDPLVVVILLAGIALAGCEGIFGGETVCTLQIEHALEVSVVDAATGQPLPDALAVARDGAFTDSARSRFPTTRREKAVASLAEERAGRYDVTVSKEGFVTWSRLNVSVEDGECHVRTVELTAELEPI